MLNFKDFILQENLLLEEPLPDSWDKEVFTKATPFTKIVKYATERAKKIGTGSSRIAFEIFYKGRPTILKIAKNKKGIAQNVEEARIMSDSALSDIVIPCIDYDTENGEDDIRWLHMEKAEKASESKLCKLINVESLYQLTLAANTNYKWRDLHISEIKEFNNQDEDKIEIAMNYVDKLSELQNDFDIEVSDFSRSANWGIYKGEPVVIDIGFTSYTKENFYS